MAAAGDGSPPDRRRRLGLALAIGATVVVLVELVSLVIALVDEVEPTEVGALWAILLMILVTFATIGLIGWGIYRSLEPGGEDAAD